MTVTMYRWTDLEADHPMPTIVLPTVLDDAGR